MSAPFLTPSVAAFLRQVNASSGPADYSPEIQRAGLNGAMAAIGWDGDGKADEVISLETGATVHLYRTNSAQPLSGTIVYVHGGSFFAGGAVSHGPLARKLAERSGATVALIDYRLAPEHRAPAAFDDCVLGVSALAGRNLGKLAIFGDSAGGLLAAATALALRGEVRPEILVLVNPMTSPTAEDDGSMAAYGTGFFAGRQDFAAGWDAYRSADGFGRFGDLLAVEDLAGLPPTIVLTNEVDPVRDQGERFAERLSASGVPVLSLRARGLIHAAWLFPKPLPEANLLFGLLSGALRSALSE
jgi:acetyl esterase